MKDTELREAAGSMWYMVRDFAEEVQSPIREITNDGFQDSMERLAVFLDEPENVNQVVSELERLSELYEADPNIMRFHHFAPPYVLHTVKELESHKRTFPNPSSQITVPRHFITDDEVNELLSEGGSYEHSAVRICDFFRDHTDLAERITFLKQEYGTGCRSTADCFIWHDNKEISYSRGSILEPYAKVTLNWNQAAKRIDSLIQSGRYLDIVDVGEIADKQSGKSEPQEPLPESTESLSSDEKPAPSSDEQTMRDEEVNQVPRYSYVPIGSEIQTDGRRFRVENVDFQADEVRLQDITFEETTAFPIFRIERPETVHRLIEEQNPKSKKELQPFVTAYDAFENRIDEQLSKVQGCNGYEDFRADVERLRKDRTGDSLVGIASAAWLNKILEMPDEELRGYVEAYTPGTLDAYAPLREGTSEQFQPQTTPAPERHNYVITDETLGVGGPKEKFRNNIMTIELLHELKPDGRLATPEEQETLARYIGWGGLADAFDESKSTWAREYQELLDVLSPEEYASAREHLRPSLRHGTFYGYAAGIRAGKQAVWSGN